MKGKPCGERIRDIRKFKGITQEELAKLSGLSTMSIRRYESGERTPNENTLRRIAMVLESSVKELLGIEEEDIQTKVEIAYRIADSIIKQRSTDNSGTDTDIFVQMFRSDVLQELGRRGVEIEERKFKRILESYGKNDVVLNKEHLEEKVRYYVVELLYKHEVFPKDINSLVAIGYSEENAWLMMERMKRYDENAEVLPPDHFEKSLEMATLIGLSLRHDKHGEEE